MKKFLSIIAAALLAFSMSACGEKNPAAASSGAASQGSSSASSSGGAIQNAIDSVKNYISGDVTGQVGKVYSTQWFDFEIKSMDVAESYATEPAYEGFKFIDVVVWEKCTFDSTIPMGTFDFYMTADGAEEEYYPAVAWDDSMMPEEFDLAPNAEGEYHVIFEVPVDAKKVSFIYVEIDENDTIGAQFTIDKTL